MSNIPASFAAGVRIGELERLLAEGCCDGCGNDARKLHGHIYTLTQRLTAAEARIDEQARYRAEIRELAQKLAAAEDELKCSRVLFNTANTLAIRSTRERDEARAKLAAAEADAARYRFLREQKSRVDLLKADGICHYRFASGWPQLRGRTLDEAVDSAIVEVAKAVKESNFPQAKEVGDD